MKNAEELKHKAAIFLEEKWNISGDTQVELDHNLEDLPEEIREGGAVDLHDIMADFVTEHDNELISEIEKKIAIEGQEMMDKKKELKKEKIMEMWDSWETYYGGRTTALTEIINLIKET